MKKIKSIFSLVYWEAIFWAIGLIYLFFVNPYQTQHFSFCPFHYLGITFCPGCGLGRSIAYFYHFDLISSFRIHPLGIIAFLLIAARIIKLFTKMVNNYHKSEEVMYG
jgi:hypothetical protein